MKATEKIPPIQKIKPDHDQFSQGNKQKIEEESKSPLGFQPVSELNSLKDHSIPQP